MAKVERLFPTYFYRNRLHPRDVHKLNRSIEKECRVFRDTDVVGRAWSRENYVGGYTSYSSIADLPYRSPTFESLRNRIDGEVRKFAKILGWNLRSETGTADPRWKN